MASSEPAAGRRPRLSTGMSIALRVLALLMVFAAGLAVGWLLQRRPAVTLPAPLPANMVRYRVRFGGDVITRYQPAVQAVTLYRSRTGIDQVVLNLESGYNWVLNADILVSYDLPHDASIERREVLNELYHHYDPYLQGEKQKMHQEWTNEQYLQWVGRLPTEGEWLEVLNEVTRGLEHRQVAEWIQYSPAACRYFVTGRFSALLGRQPRPAEERYFVRQLLDGDTYEEVETAIAALGMDKR